MPNPLNLSLATELNNNIEKVPAEIVSLDDLEEMSLVEVNRAKKQLSERKKRLQLQLDGRKLTQAQRIMDNMDLALDRMTECLLSPDMSPKDVQLLTDAYKNLLNSLNTISRLDSVDGTGKATMLSIEVKYKEA